MTKNTISTIKEVSIEQGDNPHRHSDKKMLRSKVYDPYLNKVINISEIGEQAAALAIPDQRKKVNSLSKYPYNCCGLILASFPNESFPFMGTGFLIDPEHVITVAHNIYQRSSDR